MAGTEQKRARLWWRLWLLYAAAWSAALLTTFPLEAREAIVPEEYGFSAGKLLHVTAYAGFTFLTSRLPCWRRTMLAAVILHGPLTEFLQQFVDRSASLTDVGLDWLGVMLGLLSAWTSWRRGDQSSAPPA
jgi:VanZ family protein